MLGIEKGATRLHIAVPTGIASRQDEERRTSAFAVRGEIRPSVLV